MATKPKSSRPPRAKVNASAAPRASNTGSTPAFFSGADGSGQGSLLAVLAPPAPVRPPATTPQQARRAKYELRVAALVDRTNRAARKFRKPGDAKPLAGIVLVRAYQAVVTRCFSVNDSEAKCAFELSQAHKAAVKTKKKWWKPRPYTEADARIARKFKHCKTAEMF